MKHLGAARWVAVLVVLLAVVTGCGSPGGSGADNSKATGKKIDVAKAGNVTLTVWDQEVRGGQAKQIKELNKQFMAKYPNVKIKRVSKSFNDLQATVKLAVSKPNPPDVVEANQGRPIMGQLVKAGILRKMDKYAAIFGWEKRYPKVLLDLNRFSSNGKDFGSGNLYGLSQTGEIVGVYYNKDKVKEFPKTFSDFEASLADAKKQGDVPIAFGNLDKFGGIHDYETLLAQYADKQDVQDFVFARDGASFKKPGFQDAATKFQDWAKQGYFTPKFAGTGYDPAWQKFTKGTGRFLIAGTWLVGDLQDAMGDKVGFSPMPPMDSGSNPVALGGEGLPFTITQKSKNPDVAAAYINYLTDANAAKVLTKTGNLPAIQTDARPDGQLLSQVFDQWAQLQKDGDLIPYLDYTTPTAFDDVAGAIQKLLAEKESPSQFVDDIQGKFEKFQETR